jgi:hypothetical protein
MLLFVLLFDLGTWNTLERKFTKCIKYNMHPFLYLSGFLCHSNRN